MRWVFWVVLFANTVFFAWHFSRDRDDSVQAPAQLAGLQKPLVLVSERRPVDSQSPMPPADDSQAVTPTTSSSSIPSSTQQCLRLGPFDERTQATKILTQITSLVAGEAPVVAHERVPRDYWLYIPAQKDNATTKAILSLLRRAKVEGVVMTKGERLNAISVGTYNLAIAAEKTQSKLKNIGINAVIEPRFKKALRFWIAFNPMTDVDASIVREKMAHHFPQLTLNAHDCNGAPTQPR